MPQKVSVAFQLQWKERQEPQQGYQIPKHYAQNATKNSNCSSGIIIVFFITR